MKDILTNKKEELEIKLTQQEINEEDINAAKKAADEALNNYLTAKDAEYEQEKVKINAKLELIDELIKEIK